MKKAVLFDLGDTLLQCYRPTEFGALLEEGLRNAVEVFAAAGVRPVAPVDLEERTASERANAEDFKVRPLEERLGRIFRFDPAELGEAVLDEACRAFLRPIFAITQLYPDTLPALEAIRERGMRIGIISNLPWGSPAKPWREEIARHGLDEYAEHVILCRDAGYRKPNPAIFHRALTRFEAEPSEAFFVGDRIEWDVEGAAKVGIEPIWLNRDGQPGGAGWSQIQSLTDLGSQIDREGA